MFETETRKYLLTPLYCSQVHNYFDDRNSQARPHPQFRLVICNEENCFSILLAKLREENCLQKVTSLAMDWTLDEDWLTQVEQWALFANLETLELRPSCKMGSPAGDELQPIFQSESDNFIRKYTKRPGAKLTFPLVRTLAWKFPKILVRPGNILQALLAPKDILTFPNVTTLKFLDGTMSTLLSNCVTLFPKVKCLSILMTSQRKAPPIPEDFSVLLSKLEFNVTHENNQSWEAFLNKFAPSLEHLSIRVVKNVYRDELDCKIFTLTIPVLPRLKVLQIMQCPPQFRILDPNLCHNFVRGVPQLQLIFADAPYGSLDYVAQFPSLTRLEVGREGATSPFWDGGIPPRDEFWFEICLQFLYYYFLPQLSTRCETLRFLIIPAPDRIGESWRLGRCPECKFQTRRGGVSCLWEMGAELVERLEESFPNLENLARYRNWIGVDERRW